MSLKKKLFSRYLVLRGAELMDLYCICRERDLRVVRPFVYVREKALRQFAESKALPIIPENCPACFEAPKV